MAQPGSDMQLARHGVALHVPFAARACWRWRWLGGSQKYRRAHGKFSPPGALRIPGSWVQSPGSRDACVVRGITTVGPWRYGILLGAKILKSQTSLHLPAVKFPFLGSVFFLKSAQIRARRFTSWFQWRKPRCLNPNGCLNNPRTSHGVITSDAP